MKIALRRFLHIEAISRQKEARSRVYALLISNDSQCHRQNCTHMSLNSLEHCICTITMTNIPPDRDSNLVPPSYKPQTIRKSHRDRPKEVRYMCGEQVGTSEGEWKHISGFTMPVFRIACSQGVDSFPT